MGEDLSKPKMHIVHLIFSLGQKVEFVYASSFAIIFTAMNEETSLRKPPDPEEQEKSGVKPLGLIY